MPVLHVFWSNTTERKNNVLLRQKRHPGFSRGFPNQEQLNWVCLCKARTVAISEYYRSCQQLAVIMPFKGFIYKPCIQYGPVFSQRFCKQPHWKAKFYCNGLFSLFFVSSPFSRVLFHFISQKSEIILLKRKAYRMRNYTRCQWHVYSLQGHVKVWLLNVFCQQKN